VTAHASIPTRIDPDSTGADLRASLVLLILVQVIAAALIAHESRLSTGEFFDPSQPLGSAGITIELFRSMEPWPTGLSLAVLLFLAVYRGPALDRFSERAARLVPPIWASAAFGLAATALGTEFIYRRFSLSVDEAMTVFQARIFAAGRLTAPIPKVWHDVLPGLGAPYFVMADRLGTHWMSAYQPGMAALYAVFDRIGLGAFTNAALTTGSVILVAMVARRIWPEDRSKSALAAFLLATSAQALIAGMTTYAMPAHLFFNLLWLNLFLRGRPAGHAGAAAVGAFAVSLHQIYPHVFFVMPFMLKLLHRRAWGLAAFYAVVYALACFFLLNWHAFAMSASGVPGDVGLVTGFGVQTPGFLDKYFQNRSLGLQLIVFETLMNLTRFASWQNLAALLLALLGLGRLREAPEPVRLCAWGFAWSTIPYILIFAYQGHGWGYRYLHGLLGNLVLLAVFGWSLAERAGTKSLADARRAGVLLALLSLTLLPLRADQVAMFVKPYAAAEQAIRAVPADAVILATNTIWYGDDLVQNDPFLTDRPIAISSALAPPAALAALCKAMTARSLDAHQLEQLGIVFRFSDPLSRAPAC
jgi:hypothetical protein